jgi:uncharacterized protein (TIGR00290 family)
MGRRPRRECFRWDGGGLLCYVGLALLASLELSYTRPLSWRTESPNGIDVIYSTTRAFEPCIAMSRILLSWSSGKDSAWSLYVLRQQGEYEVAGLLTTFNGEADRVAMHAVRRELVEWQASAADLPLWDVPLPWPCSNEQYELLMAETCTRAVVADIEGIAFGDLFLEDVRTYREKQMRNTGLQAIFPLWGQPTRDLAKLMIASGMRAKLTCVDTQKLDASFVGREFDDDLLAALPDGVDPCGENGEFHSFVYAGPMLNVDIQVSVGESVTHDQFVFADLNPAAMSATPSSQ